MISLEIRVLAHAHTYGFDTEFAFVLSSPRNNLVIVSPIVRSYGINHCVEFVQEINYIITNLRYILEIF